MALDQQAHMEVAEVSAGSRWGVDRKSIMYRLVVEQVQQAVA